MKFDVYCDESHPDLFTSTKSDYKYILIGSLWLPTNLRDKIKSEYNSLKKIYEVYSEIKWQKISDAHVNVYLSFINLFFEYKDDLRFRCIAVEASKVNFVKYHQNDQEMGFYKFYYQMLHHWILDFNEYTIFCDRKTNRKRDRLKTLLKCLRNSNITTTIHDVQALPSKEVILLQLTDILLGIASSRLNNSVNEDSAKFKLINALEKRLGVSRLTHTPKKELKFNIFKINLDGGW